MVSNHRTAHPDATTVTAISTQMANAIRGVLDSYPGFEKAPKPGEVSSIAARTADTAKLVGLRTVNLFSAEIEHLSRHAEDSGQPIEAQVSTALVEALQTLHQYLSHAVTGRLASGAPLLQSYNAIAALNRSPAFSRGDIFLPVFPVLARDEPSFDHGSFTEQVQRFKGEFHAAFEAFQRASSAECISNMRVALLSLEAKPSPARYRLLFSLAIAFLDILIRNGAKTGEQDQQLVAQIDCALCGEDLTGSAVSDSILSSLLYAIAQSNAFSSRVKALQETYDLVRLFTQETASMVSEKTLSNARAALESSQKAWEYALAKGGDASTARLSTVSLAGACNAIGDPALKTMSIAMGALADAIVRKSIQVSPDIGVFGASLLIAIEERLDVFASDPKGGRDEANAHKDRVRAVLQGKKPSELGASPETHQKHIHDILVHVANNLTSAEQIVDQCVRDGIKPNKAHEAVKLLDMATSTLAFVGLVAAAGVLVKISAHIQTALDEMLAGRPLDDGRNALMADAVVQMGAYLHLAIVDPDQARLALDRAANLFDGGTATGTVVTELPQIGLHDVCLDAELGPIFFEEARDDITKKVTPNLARLAVDLRDGEALTAVRRAFHTIKGSARMTDLANIGAIAQQVEYVLNIVRENSKVSLSPAMLPWIQEAASQITRAIDELERGRPAAVDPRPFEAVYLAFADSYIFNATPGTVHRDFGGLLAPASMLDGSPAEEQDAMLPLNAGSSTHTPDAWSDRSPGSNNAALVHADSARGTLQEPEADEMGTGLEGKAEVQEASDSPADGGSAGVDADEVFPALNSATLSDLPRVPDASEMELLQPAPATAHPMALPGHEHAEVAPPTPLAQLTFEPLAADGALQPELTSSASMDSEQADHAAVAAPVPGPNLQLAGADSQDTTEAAVGGGEATCIPEPSWSETREASRSVLQPIFTAPPVPDTVQGTVSESDLQDSLLPASTEQTSDPSALADLPPALPESVPASFTPPALPESTVRELPATASTRDEDHPNRSSATQRDPGELVAALAAPEKLTTTSRTLPHHDSSELDAPDASLGREGYVDQAPPVPDTDADVSVGQSAQHGLTGKDVDGRTPPDVLVPPQLPESTAAHFVPPPVPDSLTALTSSDAPGAVDGTVHAIDEDNTPALNLQRLDADAAHQDATPPPAETSIALDEAQPLTGQPTGASESTMLNCPPEPMGSGQPAAEQQTPHEAPSASTPEPSEVDRLQYAPTAEGAGGQEKLSSAQSLAESQTLLEQSGTADISELNAFATTSEPPTSEVVAAAVQDAGEAPHADLDVTAEPVAHDTTLPLGAELILDSAGSTYTQLQPQTESLPTTIGESTLGIDGGHAAQAGNSATVPSVGRPESTSGQGETSVEDANPQGQKETPPSDASVTHELVVVASHAHDEQPAQPGLTLEAAPPAVSDIAVWEEVATSLDRVSISPPSLAPAALESTAIPTEGANLVGDETAPADISDEVRPAADLQQEGSESLSTTGHGASVETIQVDETQNSGIVEDGHAADNSASTNLAAAALSSARVSEAKINLDVEATELSGTALVDSNSGAQQTAEQTIPTEAQRHDHQHIAVEGNFLYEDSPSANLSGEATDTQPGEVLDSLNSWNDLSPPIFGESVQAERSIEDAAPAELSTPPMLEPVSETVAESPAVAADSRTELRIGSISLPRSLFDAFMPEATRFYNELEILVRQIAIGQTDVIEFEVIRLSHSLAGMGRAIGLNPIVELASRLETWANIQQDQILSVDRETASTLSATMDSLRAMLDGLKQCKEPASDREICVRLDQLIEAAEHQAAHGQIQASISPSQRQRLEDGSSISDLSDLTDISGLTGIPNTKFPQLLLDDEDDDRPREEPTNEQVGPAVNSPETAGARFRGRRHDALADDRTADGAYGPSSKEAVAQSRHPETTAEVDGLAEGKGVVHRQANSTIDASSADAASPADGLEELARQSAALLEALGDIEVPQSVLDAIDSMADEAWSGADVRFDEIAAIPETAAVQLPEAATEQLDLGQPTNLSPEDDGNRDEIAAHQESSPSVPKFDQNLTLVPQSSRRSTHEVIIESQFEFSRTEAVFVAPARGDQDAVLIDESSSHHPHVEAQTGGQPPISTDDGRARLAEDRGPQLWEEILASKVDDIDPEMKDIFLEEAQERFLEIDGALGALATDPANRKLANQVKRVVHTLKGSANTTGARKVGAVFHYLEDLMDETPLLSLDLVAAIQVGVDAAFSVIEALRHQITSKDVAQVPFAPANSHDRPPAYLEQPMPDNPVVGASSKAAPNYIDDSNHTLESGTANTTTIASTGESTRASKGRKEDEDTNSLRITTRTLDRMVKTVGEINISRTRVGQSVEVAKGAMSGMALSLERMYGHLRDIGLEAEKQIHSGTSHSKGHSEFDALQMDTFTRLQELTRRVAEAQNDVMEQHGSTIGAVREIEEAVATQRLLVNDVAGEIDRVRQVRVSSIVPKLKRVVRSACRDTGRQGEINFDADVEIDRGILEKINGAIEHILRNAIAHGIESPEERTVVGKEVVGTIEFKAYQDGSEVVIEIKDDGHGIDSARVLRRAVERGIVKPGTRMAEDKIRDLLFEPGFTTADAVSDIAGRGVGLDVVRSDLSAMGGRVDVSSKLGFGTTFTLRMPATLTVLAGSSVITHGHSYVIPVSFIDRLVRIEQKDLEVAYRNQRLIVKESNGETIDFDFWGMWQLVGATSGGMVPGARASILLMRGDRVAIHVDEVRPAAEFVFRPMGPQVSVSSGLIGSTINSAGKATLVVDPARVVRNLRSAANAEQLAIARSPIRKDLAPLVLIVDDSLTVRKVTARLLRNEGFRYLEAASGLEALEQIQTEMPSVVLMDIEMPGMNGYEATRAIRGTPATRHVPIIMITSRVGDSHRQLAIELGVNDYLGKPYDAADLLDSIRRLISQPQLAHA